MKRRINALTRGQSIYPPKKLKKLENTKVMFLPIVIGALGTVIEGLLNGKKDLEIRELGETIKTTPLLGTARIQNRVLET